MHSSLTQDYSSILDPNWIATILSVVFTLFIFLLTVPILFFQTFLPEDIREVYNKSIHHSGKKALRLFGIGLGICLLFFGNHAVPFILHIYINYISRVIPYSQFINIYIVYYFISLLFFSIFTLLSYRYFKKTVFKKGNIRKEVVEHLVKRLAIILEEKYELNDDESEELLNDLSMLGNSFNPGCNKSIVILETRKLIELIVINSLYTGGEAFKLVEIVLLPTINSASMNEQNFLEVISCCQLIVDKYKNSHNLKTYDSNSVIKLLNYISEVTIKKDQIDFTMISLNCLRPLPNSQNNLYNFCKKSFKLGYYKIVTIEIFNLMQFIDTIDNNSKNNLIAFLSWFYVSDNLSMNRFAKHIYSQINSINLEQICEASEEFFFMSEFDTASNITSFRSVLNV